MTRDEEKQWVDGTVAALRSTFRLPADPQRCGPVALAQLLSEHNLTEVALPKLSRAVVYDFLLAKGTFPGDLGEEEDLAGFLYVSGPFGRVFVNADDPVPRQRFTAAHELGHFVLHRDHMGGKISIGDTPATVIEVADDTLAEMERQANRFAAVLLMPEEVCRARAIAFRRTYKVCPPQPFAYQLSAELLVSPTAMQYRLAELGVADE